MNLWHRFQELLGRSGPWPPGPPPPPGPSPDQIRWDQHKDYMTKTYPEAEIIYLEWPDIWKFHPKLIWGQWVTIGFSEYHAEIWDIAGRVWRRNVSSSPDPGALRNPVTGYGGVAKSEVPDA